MPRAELAEAINGIERAFRSMVRAVHLTAEQQHEARHIIDNVTKAVEEVESNAHLDKAAKEAKIRSAIDELAHLQKKWAVAAASAAEKALRQKKATLKEELAEKQRELAQDETLKVSKLKELARKKMLLDDLRLKEKMLHDRKHQEEEVKEREGIMANLTAFAKAAAGSKKGSNATQAILSDLESRSQMLKEDIKRLDMEEEKAEAAFDRAQKAFSESKGQSMIKMIRKQQHRHFERSRASKAAELAALKSAEMSIQAGDVKALMKAIANLQELAAKRSGFLH